MIKKLFTIPKEWNETTLGEVTELIIDYRGLTPKKLGGDWSATGYRAISAKSIKNGQLVNEDQMNILSEDLYKKWMKDEVQYGDIFLTSEAPLGEHIIWKSSEKLVLSQRIFGIRTSKEVLDPFYFNYFIDSNYYQHELKSRESGSTVTGIKQSELVKTRVILPPLPEQKAIAAVLSSLDDKIELLREQNKTLESLAQTIFKEWFVKFNFPNENGTPYKDNGGKMIDSEIGPIPERWRIESLSKVIEFEGGAQPPKSEHIYESRSGYIRFIQNRDYSNGSHVTYIKESKKNKTCDVLDIMMDKYGEVGTPRYGLSGAYNVALAKIIPKIKNSGEYLRSFFSQPSVYNLLSSSAQASTRGSLNAGTFKGIDIVIPANDILKLFEDSQLLFLKKILFNLTQIHTLFALRDLILPKLMKGEVRVAGLNN